MTEDESWHSFHHIRLILYEIKINHLENRKKVTFYNNPYFSKRPQAATFFSYVIPRTKAQPFSLVTLNKDAVLLPSHPERGAQPSPRVILSEGRSPKSKDSNFQNLEFLTFHHV
ncbi:hypothetical protein [Bifidobacterium lemurum]|uniref:hypothetical protein n=1 Tax=Bifidobacterium lemurum TaxID=1603886 RepID=UPI00135630A1|nr:hypothetical protein [Bifidobacterium lemurum]